MDPPKWSHRECPLRGFLPVVPIQVVSSSLFTPLGPLHVNPSSVSHRGGPIHGVHTMGLSRLPQEVPQVIPHGFCSRGYIQMLHPRMSHPVGPHSGYPLGSLSEVSFQTVHMRSPQTDPLRLFTSGIPSMRSKPRVPLGGPIRRSLPMSKCGSDLGSRIEDNAGQAFLSRGSHVGCQLQGLL
jgi:hypothetical protein